MDIVFTPHAFNAALKIPPSKSHTIRRLFFAALTDGISQIEQPLFSLDTQSCADACRVLGAEITEERDKNDQVVKWIVRGKKAINKETPQYINVGNSGTTLFFGIAAAALLSQNITFTGDRQTARRSADPLLEALAALGVKVNSQNGCIPITVCGPLQGGSASLPCVTSQYLSAMLIAAPLAHGGTITEIDVPLLNERPYIEMTLSYLKSQGLYGNSNNLLQITGSADFSRFKIHGGNTYSPINGPVPGDFSSAVYPAAAAVLSRGKAVLQGLDPQDIQGDKIFFDYLSKMGCDVKWDQGQLTVTSSYLLHGGVFDLNAAPDLLPIMAVLGSFAAGETKLVNAGHARIKETDRIAVMAEALTKLFAGNNNFGCEEKPEGLIIRGIGGKTAGDRTKKRQAGITLDGHGDHRVVLSLACAAMGMSAEFGQVTLIGAEAADHSYPGFLNLLQ